MLGTASFVVQSMCDVWRAQHSAACLSSSTNAHLAAGHAPVSKSVLWTSVGATLLSHVTRNSYRRMPVALAHSAHLLAFRSSGELLCGALLLYYFR